MTGSAQCVLRSDGPPKVWSAARRFYSPKAMPACGTGRGGVPLPALPARQTARQQPQAIVAPRLTGCRDHFQRIYYAR